MNGLIEYNNRFNLYFFKMLSKEIKFILYEYSCHIDELFYLTTDYHATVTTKLIKVLDNKITFNYKCKENGYINVKLTDKYNNNIKGYNFQDFDYKLQYAFKNGEIVDAVIFVKEKIIPIDSKFSLENYNRILESETKPDKEIYEKKFRNDLKTRIDETSKYIRPEEGTMEFAFMFLPSEGMYYDLLVNKVGRFSSSDLIEYAFKEKKVIIVSPTSFLCILTNRYARA